MKLTINPVAEAIRYQGTEVIDAIADILDKYFLKIAAGEGGVKLREEYARKLQYYVNKRFDMKFEIKFHDSFFTNANIRMEPITADHNYYKKYKVNISKKTLKHYNDKGIMVGGVNEETVKATDVFKEIKFKMNFYYNERDIVKKNINKVLTPHEAAAVVLHEVGHGFCWLKGFNFLTNKVTILSSLAKMMHDNEVSMEDKWATIFANKKTLKLTTKELEELKQEHQSSSPGTVVNLLMVGAWNPNTSGDNLFNYTLQDMEHDADDFAIKMGARGHLARGLEKILGRYGSASYGYGPQIVTRVLEVLGILTFAHSYILSGLAFMYHVLIIGLLTDPKANIVYGTYSERLRVMRSTLIQQMKQANPDELKDFKNDLAALDTLIDRIKIEGNFSTLIRQVFDRSFSQNIKDRKLMLDLLEISNNRLFMYTT